MLNTRYFRFGCEFRLSVPPSERDFYEENISALEANFLLAGSVDMHAIYITLKISFIF